MRSPVSDVLGGLIATWWLFMLLVGITIGVAWPLMVFSIMRNIKGIRGELRQLNETLGSKMTITKSGPLGL